MSKKGKCVGAMMIAMLGIGMMLLCCDKKASARKQFRKKVDEAVDTALDMIEQAAQRAEEIFEE